MTIDLALRSALMVSASCLALRLSGLGPVWLPSAAALLMGVVALQLARLSLAQEREGTATWRWLTLARKHSFVLSLACLASVGLALRLVGIGADLFHTPITIDEGRLARSVLSFLR